MKIDDIRKNTIEKVLARQDDSFRWGFNEKQARERPENLYYAPNFTSTLWTAILLADLTAPVHIPRVEPSIRLLRDHFYDRENGIFGFPGKSHFPIPCLNGNMIYLINYFDMSHVLPLDETIGFFSRYQRFDDGGFKTPKSYPFCSNTSCYGKHTCYWGVTKLLKGMSFIPAIQRNGDAQRFIEHGIDFVMHHEVCFSSRQRDRFLHRDIVKLAFPNFYKSDFLEILWLLAREGVHDRRMSRALELLRSRMKDGGVWNLEKKANTIVPVGQQDRPNAFITERAIDVLDYYGIER